MTEETLFLYLIAAVSFLFAFYNAFRFFTKRSQTAQTTGTIISITSPNPETAKARNSKWAKVTYRVNGNSYTSQNRVQVPMTAQIGSSVTVRYDLKQPERLYSFSLTRIFVSVLIAGVCIVAAAFHLVYR